MITRAWLWLHSVLFRARLEREMQEEISTHLRARPSGSRHRACRRTRPGGAPREFGNVAAIKEAARDARGGRAIESVLADLRYGVRRL